MAEEEHQLRDGALCRAIESAGHTGLQELVSCLVTMHLYAACPALRDVDNDDASLYRLFQHVEEPILARGITTAKGLHHDPFQPGNIQYALHHLRGDAREELEDSNDELRKQVTELNDQIHKLNETLDNLEDNKELTDEQLKKIEELTALLKESNKKVLDLMETIENQQKEIDTLKTELLEIKKPFRTPIGRFIAKLINVFINVIEYVFLRKR